MCLPSGEICGSVANWRLKTSNNSNLPGADCASTKEKQISRRQQARKARTPRLRMMVSLLCHRFGICAKGLAVNSGSPNGSLSEKNRPVKEFQVQREFGSRGFL